MSFKSVTTREQRIALKRVFDRCPLQNSARPIDSSRDISKFIHRAVERDVPGPVQVVTYRQFRRNAFLSWDTVMIPWCGMWLGIEPDGYTHS